jgi:beta-N-acetylhexosaminidase
MRLVVAVVLTGPLALVRPAAAQQLPGPPVRAHVTGAGCLPPGLRGLPSVDPRRAGQLVVGTLPGPALDPATRRLLRAHELAGLLLFARNVRSAGQVGALDRAVHAASGHRALVAVDQEGGQVRRLPFAAPAASAAAQARLGPRGVREMWRRAAGQLRSLGVDVDFAPVADLAIPGGFEGSRTFGPVPGQVGALVAATVAGLRGGGVGSSAKHFPGLGGARVNTDRGTARGLPVSARGLMPFAAAVRAGVPMIMVDLAVHPGLGPRPAALGPAAYHLLRDRLGFRGVAITDALDAGAARAMGDEATTAVRAICAGADLVLAPGGPVITRRVAAAIAAAVRDGRIPAARFAEAQARVNALLARPEGPPSL